MPEKPNSPAMSAITRNNSAYPSISISPFPPHRQLGRSPRLLASSAMNAADDERKSKRPTMPGVEVQFRA
jgi:hypothetical protein